MSAETLRELEPGIVMRGLEGLRRVIDTYRPVQPDTITELSLFADQVKRRRGELLTDEPRKVIMIIDPDPAPPKTEAFKCMFYQELEDRFGQTIQTTSWGITRNGRYESRVASVRNGVDDQPTSRRWTENQAQAMIDMAYARLTEPLPMPAVTNPE